MRLDEREMPSCVKEAEVSSPPPFMRTVGKFDYVITVRSLERREAEMFLWSWISVEAWSFGLNENEELRKVSTAKE